MGDARQVTFFDGDHLVAIQSSKQFDLASHSAIPVYRLKHRLRELSMVLVPPGLLIGLALSLAVFLLARQQNSMPTMLRLALKRREFTLLYQPEVALHIIHMAKSLHLTVIGEGTKRRRSPASCSSMVSNSAEAGCLPVHNRRKTSCHSRRTRRRPRRAAHPVRVLSSLNLMPLSTNNHWRQMLLVRIISSDA